MTCEAMFGQCCPNTNGNAGPRARGLRAESLPAEYRSSEASSCRIRSDRQTTSLTLTTGVCEAGTKMRGESNMNIHYDVTGLLTAAWRSHSGQIVWAA